MLRNPAHLALESCSGNRSPQCTGLWWLMELDTRKSWSTVGGWGSCCLGEPAHSVGSAKTQHQSGRFKDTSSAISVPKWWGLERILSGKEWKSKWHIPSPPPMELVRCLWQPALKLSTYTAAVPSCAPVPPGMVYPVAVQHCWLAPPTMNPSRSTSHHRKDIQRPAVGISHCWQTCRKFGSPHIPTTATAAQLQQRTRLWWSEGLGLELLGLKESINEEMENIQKSQS